MTAIATLPVLLQTGTHGSRPAASAVGSGALYACSTHKLIYQMLAGSWGTWADLSGTVTTVTASTCRAINNGTQTVSSGVAFVDVNFDTDIHDDADYHFTSAANLTGTVTKASASATLTGSGTSFTTELTVGQVIDVPGTATERRVVTAIASNTSLTVNSAYANSASGQTATRVNSTFVAVTAGTYRCSGYVKHEQNGSGTQRVATLVKNGSEISGTEATVAPSGGYDPTVQTTATLKLAQWDYITLAVYQDSGGNRTIGAGTGGKSCSFNFERLGS